VGLILCMGGRRPRADKNTLARGDMPKILRRLEAVLPTGFMPDMTPNEDDRTIMSPRTLEGILNEVWPMPKESMTPQSHRTHLSTSHRRGRF
jgi:hypothetical protein